jgi:hypothetical protein
VPWEDVFKVGISIIVEHEFDPGLVKILSGVRKIGILLMTHVFHHTENRWGLYHSSSYGRGSSRRIRRWCYLVKIMNKATHKLLIQVEDAYRSNEARPHSLTHLI